MAGNSLVGGAMVKVLALVKSAKTDPLSAKERDQLRAELEIVFAMGGKKLQDHHAKVLEEAKKLVLA